MERDVWLEAVWGPYATNPVPALIIGPRNGVLRLNRAMMEFVGYARDEVPDETVFLRKCIPNRSYRGAVLRILQAAGDGSLGVVRREVSLTGKDGEERFTELAVFPFENEGTYLLLLWYDVTDEHHSFEELVRSREMFRLQYVSLPLPAFTCKRTEEGFLLVDLNMKAEELASGQGSHYVGQFMQELFPDVREIPEDMERCRRRKGTVRRGDLRAYFAPAREERFFDLTYVYIPPHFVITHIDDRTEDRRLAKALQESLERYRALFEKANDAVIIHDPDGTIHEANRTSARMLEIGKKRLVGTNLLQLIPREDRKRVGEQLTAAAKKAVRFETEFVSSRGRHIAVDVSTVTLDRDGGSLQSIIRNVTAGKQYRDALKRAKDDLERTVRERTHELTEANRLLQAEIRRRQQQEQRLVELTDQLQSANRELKHLSLFDGLTNIPNRRFFDQVIEAEWKRAKRSGEALSLVLMDIDFFKLFNDTYGHLRGDECLKMVAGALRETVRRPADFISRYGGEEFAVILPGTDLKGAEKIADGIAHRLHELNIRHETSRVSDRLTVSMGIAVVSPYSSMRLTRLIQAADEALYRAKECGRDRIEMKILDTGQATCKNQ